MKGAPDAREFWTTWKNVICPILDQYYYLFNNDKEWTDTLFGKNPLVPEKIRSELGISRLRINDHLIDGAFGGSENLIYINDSRRFWPVKYTILLEHENLFDQVDEELFKLINRRSPLKVIVTYKVKQDPIIRIDEKVKMFCSIIKKSNAWFPENESTEYLCIFGYRNETDSALLWRAFIFNIKGEYLELK